MLEMTRLSDLEQLSREELIQRLQQLEGEGVDDREANPARLLHDLQVHQLELEMQNRELRESRQLLEESQQRYADLYDFAPVGYFTLDRSGRILAANLTGANLVGHERSRILGRRLGGVVRLHEPDRLREHLERCIGRQEAVTSELTFVPLGGLSVTVQAVSVPSLAPEGECRTALVDITARKRSEQSLRFLATASESLTREFEPDAALEAVARLAVPLLGEFCIIDVLEADGTLRRVRPAFADASRWPDSDRIGGAHPSVERLSPQTEVLRRERPVVHLDCKPSTFLMALDASGRSRVPAGEPRSLMALPMSARGRILAVLTLGQLSRHYTPYDLELAQDFAVRAAMAVENAQLAAASARAVRMREEVLEIVSHDLGTWVHAVRLNVELLQRAPEQPAVIREGLRRIGEGIEGMDHLLGDLLDLRRIERGGLSLLLGLVPLSRLLREAHELFASQLVSRKIRFQLEEPPEEMMLFCDRRRVLQVLANLLGNALKFTRSAGAITLRGQRISADEARISVQDDGMGIEPDQLGQIFERYWQASGSSRQGSGLGLFISKRIVEAQDGIIEAVSAPGQGTTISFTLPIATSLPIASSLPEDAHERLLPAARGLVLMVDDNRAMLAAMRALLQSAGYQTAQAENGAVALELVRAERPALMLLDLRMPVLDGWETLKALRADPALGGFPVLLLSSEARLEPSPESLGAAGFLRKPVMPAELLGVIARLLAGAP
jgi:PAS domain S-box-containing protein